MKYDLPPELSGRTATDMPSLARWLQHLQRDTPDWVSRSVNTAFERLDRARLAAHLPADRVAIGELCTSLQSQRALWVQRLVQALSQAMEVDGAAAVQADRADAGTELTLTLLDEDTIDEDIALSRLVQAAEGGAEAALRELAARCSSIRGLPHVSLDANPMRPAVVASAVRQAVAGCGLPPQQRVLLLRELGAAIGSQLIAVYNSQRDQLIDWGVEPSRFKLRLTLGDPQPFASATTASTPSAAAQPGPAEGPPAAQMAAAALRRLGLDDAVAPAGTADEMMARLLAVLLSRTALNDDTRALIQRLDEPARRIAARDPHVWQSPDHPLWHLLDRLVLAGQGPDKPVAADGSIAAGADPTGAALERAVQQLAASAEPDSIDCQAALAAVDFAVSSLIDEQAVRVAPQAEALDRQQARAGIELSVREQIVQQVRGNGAPPALRQFLVGPWAATLAHSAITRGQDSAQMRVQAELVDELIGACSRPPGVRLPGSLIGRCITHARLGLEAAGFAAARVQAELADLEQVLQDPWQQRAGDRADADSDDAMPNGLPPFAATAPFADTASFDPVAGMGLHDALPTVPIDMGLLDGMQADDNRSAASAAWIDSLQPGQFCRLFLLNQWINAHLVWCSSKRTMFVFNSRHGGRTHSLSRRALDKLRAAGLAATIERGQFIAQAMRELAGQSGSSRVG